MIIDIEYYKQSGDDTMIMKESVCDCSNYCSDRDQTVETGFIVREDSKYSQKITKIHW